MKLIIIRCGIHISRQNHTSAQHTSTWWSTEAEIYSRRSLVTVHVTLTLLALLITLLKLDGRLALPEKRRRVDEDEEAEEEEEEEEGERLDEKGVELRIYGVTESKKSSSGQLLEIDNKNHVVWTHTTNYETHRKLVFNNILL